VIIYFFCKTGDVQVSFEGTHKQKAGNGANSSFGARFVFENLMKSKSFPLSSSLTFY
jgi:hypothetical protein